MAKINESVTQFEVHDAEILAQARAVLDTCHSLQDIQVAVLAAFCSPRARLQTGLHFEAFYVSCFCREKQYYRKEGGQDLCRLGHFAASNYVQVHDDWLCLPNSGNT